MDLDFSQQQRILKRSAQEFLKKECPPSLLREFKNDERGYPQRLWDQMADLGWTGVMIPEKYGGLGGNFLDLCILLEAMGENCCPGPFFSTVVLGGLAIMSAGSEKQKETLDRKQFGRPIGSFQAVQHHCANMAIDVDGSRFITYQAAWKISEELPASMETAMAKAWTSSASRRVTTLAHQIHGAISFTEEVDLHLYYRRAKAGELAFGDSEYHFEKVARQLGL